MVEMKDETMVVMKVAKLAEMLADSKVDEKVALMVVMMVG
jgi:hypothetical protein